MNCWFSRNWLLVILAIILVLSEKVYDTYCKPHK